MKPQKASGVVSWRPRSGSVRPIAAKDFLSVLDLTHALRDAGMRAEFALGGQTMSKQQDIAKARNARLLVTVGSAEIQVKDLKHKDRTPQAVPVTGAVVAIQAALQSK